MVDQRVRAWALHQLQLHAAQSFIERCEAEGIAVLPVKGIVTAFTLYDDPTERSLRDVDVRIAPKELGRVLRVAGRCGWPIVERSRAYRNVVLSVGGVDVDVEAAVGPPHFCPVSIEQMLARAERSTVLGFPSMIPAPLDHMVVLVVNAFKDKMVLAQPGAIEDLERLASQRSFDPSETAAYLARHDLVTVGWYVAAWMANARQSEGWAEVQKRLTPVLRRRRYAVRLGQLNARAPNGLRSRVLTRAASDHAGARMMTLGTTLWWQLEAWFGWHHSS